MKCLSAFGTLYEALLLIMARSAAYLERSFGLCKSIDPRFRVPYPSFGVGAFRAGLEGS